MKEKGRKSYPSDLTDAGTLATDRERVEYFNDYIRTLLAYEKEKTAGITQTFAPHAGELKAACGSYARAMEFLCAAADIPCFTISTKTHIWNLVHANDPGHFFMLVERMGYEISHGNRLGFRLRGQERFIIPGRKNPLFTEEGIQAAIQGNLEAIESGDRPAVVYRTPYKPFKILALWHNKYLFLDCFQYILLATPVTTLL